MKTNLSLDKIKSGNYFANYRELCNYLGLKFTKNPKQRERVLNRIRNVFILDKHDDGSMLIVGEKNQLPAASLENTEDSKYIDTPDLLEYVLANIIVNLPKKPIIITRSKCCKLTGITSNLFDDEKTKETIENLREQYCIDNYSMDKYFKRFYLSTVEFAYRNLEKAFKHLQEKRLIDFIFTWFGLPNGKQGNLNALNNLENISESLIELTAEQIEKISLIELDVLAKMNTDRQHIFGMPSLQEKFYNIVEKEISEKLNLCKTFKAYRIIPMPRICKFELAQATAKQCTSIINKRAVELLKEKLNIVKERAVVASDSGFLNAEELNYPFYSEIMNDFICMYINMQEDTLCQE